MADGPDEADPGVVAGRHRGHGGGYSAYGYEDGGYVVERRRIQYSGPRGCRGSSDRGRGWRSCDDGAANAVVLNDLYLDGGVGGVWVGGGGGGGGVAIVESGASAGASASASASANVSVRLGVRGRVGGHGGCHSGGCGGGSHGGGHSGGGHGSYGGHQGGGHSGGHGGGHRGGGGGHRGGGGRH